MPYVLDLLYLVAGLLAVPWLAWRAWARGKRPYRLWARFWGEAPRRTGERPCVWFHGVSVGEVLLLRPVVAEFRQQRPDWEVVISSTTQAGCQLAQRVFADLTVFVWPLDFTWAVRRALRRVRPSLVVLAELELWPNFLAVAGPQLPVAVINGRLSSRSFRGYAWLGRWWQRRVGQLRLLAMQTPVYAQRIRSLGAAPERVFVTGSVKYDGVNLRRDHPRTRELGRLLGLDRWQEGDFGSDGRLVWVVGSTQAPEEETALGIYQRLRRRFPQLRLVLVPRHPERFDAVADLVVRHGLPLLRRSRLTEAGGQAAGREASSAAGDPPVLLLDTLGELAWVWGLADVAFVGGSLSRRGGQNMIEPAACGVAVTFGPHVWNFQETVDRLLENQAAVQVADAREWEAATAALLGDAGRRRRLGEAAQRFVLSQQGATQRTVRLLLPLTDRALTRQAA
jgi:3-deoxy-D-manno-octulosonic-acid transferase